MNMKTVDGAADDVRALLLEYRNEISAECWNRGIHLSREATFNAVPGADTDEVRVRIVRRPVGSWLVVLYPEEVDASCSCDSVEDFCEHVAAALIALNTVAADGDEMADEVAGRFAYELQVDRAEQLTLTAVLVQGDREEPVEGRLSGAVRTMHDGEIVVTTADRTLARLFQWPSSEPIPHWRMSAVLAALATAPDVRLNGRVVCVDDAPPAARAVVLDADDGFAVSFEPVALEDRRFSNGAAMFEGRVAPWAYVPATRRYPWDRIEELINKALPELRERGELEIGATTLPMVLREAPHIQIATTAEGRELHVLATIVYGTPPVARLDAGRLTLYAPTRVVPLRDLGAEITLKRTLDGLALPDGRVAVHTGAEAIALANALRGLPCDVQGDGLDAFQSFGELTPHVRASKDGLNVTFATADGREVSAALVLESWRDQAGPVPVSGGGWAELPLDWLSHHGQSIIDILEASHERKILSALVRLEIVGLLKALNSEVPQDLRALEALTETDGELPDAVLPEDLTATLRSYQRIGVNWLSAMRAAGLGALLGDDMGLGKTLQAMCVIDGKTLVVVPTSVLDNWASELKRFRPSLRVNLTPGPRRSMDRDADVTLTSWALLHRDIEVLAKVKWAMVVLDEAQAMKNPTSRTARAACRLDAEFRVMLTGTPIENNLDEIWSLFRFLNPGLLRGRKEFDLCVARPIRQGIGSAARDLRERLRPFILRRLKSEVATELPARTDVVLKCELTLPERTIYDATYLAAEKEIVDCLDTDKVPLKVLEKLLRMRQAACHPNLVPGHAASTSSKLELLITKLHALTGGGHKALVFSQWTEFLDIVQDRLRRESLDFVRLDGKTKKRGAVVSSFQDPDGPPVMLISLKAGGTGLNLTEADHVFLLDPWWNPAVEDQAAGRIHRIGQARPVVIHRLVAADTFDEKIIDLQEQKRALAQALLSGTDQATGPTMKDVKDLFRS